MANIIFHHQKWERHSKLENDKSDNNEQDDDIESDFSADEEPEPCTSSSIKRRKLAKNLTYTLPSNDPLTNILRMLLCLISGPLQIK